MQTRRRPTTASASACQGAANNFMVEGWCWGLGRNSRPPLVALGWQGLDYETTGLLQSDRERGERGAQGA